MSGTHDLDALLDEIDGKGESVTLFGKSWTLPVDVDADTMLRVQRLQMKIALAKRAGREVDPDDVLDDAVSIDDLVERMAGQENYRAWLTHEWTDAQGNKRTGLGYRGMLAVAGRLYAIHSGEGEAPGKAPRNGPAKRTKKTTASSRSRSKPR